MPKAAASLLALLLLLFAASSALAQHNSAGDQTSIGKQVVVAVGQTVDGDLTVFGGGAQISGLVRGSVTVIGGKLEIVGGQVGGNVTAIGGDISLQGKANASHDVTALGGGVSKGNEAVVGGHLSAGGVEWLAFLRDYAGLGSDNFGDRLAGLGPMLLYHVYWVVAVFLFGLLLLRLAARSIDNTSITLDYAPAWALLVGFVTSVTIPAVLLALFSLLLASFVGVLAVPVVLAVVALAVGYSLVVVALWLGERITGLLGQPNYSDARRQVVPLLIGLLVVLSLTILLGLVSPLLGGAFNLLTISFGLGAAVLSRFGLMRPARAPAQSTASPRKRLAGSK